MEDEAKSDGHVIRTEVTSVTLVHRQNSQPFAGPASSARRSATAHSSLEFCRFSGSKHFRPLLRTVVDGEDHDIFGVSSVRKLMVFFCVGHNAVLLTYRFRSRPAEKF